MSKHTMSGSKLDSFIKWATENGVKIDENIDFEFSEKNGYSAVIKDIGKFKSTCATKKPLITVPQSLFIDPSASVRYFYEYYKREIKSLNKNVENLDEKLFYLYVAKLKFDSHDSDAFKPYFDILPRCIYGIPYYYSKAEIDLLKGSDAGIFLKRNLGKLLTEWQELMIFMAKFEDSIKVNKTNEFVESFSVENPELTIADDHSQVVWHLFRAYVWAVTIVTSRAFPYIIVSPEINSAFLLPVVDLLNHENAAKVSWNFSESEFMFRSSYSDINEKSVELFNNYGDKANIDLLFAYGFAIENNEFDKTTISLRITESQLINAQSITNSLKDAVLINKEAINFELTKKNALPTQLVDFFASLVQLSSEKGQYTLRMKLEGLTQLKRIVESKISIFKNVKYVGINNQHGVLTTIKSYNNGQRKLFQTALEEINKLEKSLIKKYKPVSFKTVIKQDKQFMNALLLTFGVTNYQDLVDKNIVDQVFMLWVLRTYNTGNVDFVKKQFDEVKNSIVVTKEDVLEYKDLYNFLFPNLMKKLPEVFKENMDWSAKLFIVAGTVADRIAYTRDTSKELLILEKLLVN